MLHFQTFLTLSRALAAAATGSLLLLAACNGGAADLGTSGSSSPSGSLGEVPASRPSSSPATAIDSAPFRASDGLTGPLATPRLIKTDALLYDGVATAYNDDDSIADILTHHGMTFQRISSAELNKMSLEEMTTYGTIIWPGGYASQMSDSLKPDTRERIREAVVEKGVSFFGICAGAWMAVSPAPLPGGAPAWGLSIVPGAVMDEYMPSGIDGIEMTPLTIAGESKTTDLVWYGGPALPNWKTGVFARYKNGTPAMVQTWSGHGFVVLTSPHPEAPQIWRDQHGLRDTDGLDFDLAFRLIQAAKDQQPLPTL